MPQLELYKFDRCPFCQKVMEVIWELKLAIDYQDIHQEPLARKKLWEETGRQTVPCLFIDGAPMFESADIVKWLRDNHNSLAKRV